MKKPPSWVPVVILLFLFPPVGVYLLYKKLSFGQDLHKQASLLLVFGIVLTVISLGGMTQSGYTFILFVIGVSMLVLSHKRKKLADRYESYRSLVYQQRIYSLDHIATQLSTRYESVVSDFNTLLTLNQFPGARIDFQSRMLLVPDYTPPQQPGQTGSASPGVDQVVEQVAGAVSQVVSSVNQAVGQVISTSQPQKEQIVTVQCKSCGANNRVSTASGGECEYCGSPLSSD